MEKYSVFNPNNKSDHTKNQAFLDKSGSITLQRYESLKYRQFDKLTDKSLGFFWRPEEVDVIGDSKDFKELTEHERHIFTSNLKRQILLDSVQGRSPNLAFLPIVSVPEIEAFIETWAFFETIHSRAYTHIIRNVYSNPSKIFDEMMDLEEIVKCSKDISVHYDNLIELSNWYRLLGEGTHTINDKKLSIKVYDLKKLLWLAIMSVNILEGVRFYVSFACSWAFAELKKMEGNAKLIKFIARDENVHLAATQQLLKILPQDDPDFIKIREDTLEQCAQLYIDAVEQEKDWAKFLFNDGSMIGLNELLLSEYIEWIATKRMQAIGIKSPYSVPQANPLPWTQKWIAGGEVQVAPQQTQISSYILGGTKQDLDGDTFKGITL